MSARANRGAAWGARRWMRWLLLGLALLLLWLTLRSVPLGEVWAQLQQLRPGQILLLAAANVLVLATFSARWWILLAAQGYPLPYGKLMAYRLAAFAVSYFTPGPHFGGEPLQVYVVAKRHEVPAAVSLAAVVLDKLIEMLFNFTFLVLGLAFVLQGGTGLAAGPLPSWAAGSVSVLFLLPVAILAALAMGGRPLSGPLVWLLAWLLVRLPRRVRRHRRPRPGGAAVSTHTRLGRFVLTLRESEDLGHRLFRRKPWALVAAVAVTVMSWGAIVGEFWLMTYVLGLRLSVGEALVALLAARAAILLPLPAAVGVLEASQALAMASLGLPPAYGISLSLLIRGRDVLLGLAGLGLAARYMPGKEASGAPPPA